MHWLCKYKLLLLLHLVHNVLALQWDVPTIESGASKHPTSEVPKPIQPQKFEELDAAYRGSRKLNLRVRKTAKSRRPSLIDVALQVAAKEGLVAMTNLYQNIEPEIVKNGQLLEDNHPAALLSKFSAPTESSQQSAMAAFATIAATKAFRRNNKETTVLGRQAQSQKISFRRTPLEGLCPPRDPPTCMPAAQRYRTHDGTCNNRRRPRWGSAQMPFNRFLPPEYGDGVDSIRGSVEGGPLSSARFVSLLVHGAREGEAPLTLMIAQWGQLLDHDVTSTAQPRSINGSVPSCCGAKDFHPSCFPIKVPLDDPWLAPLKVRCLEFLRSAPAQRRDCVLSWREQTNQVTSFVDASPIYSSSAKTSDNARIFRNGLLVFGRGNPADDVCMRGAIAHQCIRSGDGRSGEQPGLLALHHVWVGEHNRIAMELSNLNPHWSDEKVYQETRRIIGALFQHITYREFLPIVLGREVCKLFDLELLNSGFYTGYDPNTNPSVSNSFAAAAFRFGHSLVQNTYMRCDRHHNFINNNVTLHEEFQQGDIGTAGSLHRLLRGLATQRALKRDEFITPELTNHLFQTPGFPFGLDLAAINIQRGRDHGIAPYTSWRQPCGLSPITSWDDLSSVVGPESAKRISHAYRNVHDIDLFVGGIAERPVVGGLVGPTFSCIIAQQFSNSRKGDRFWYENPGFESSFTPAQLHSLRHVSLSSVLCRAVGGGTFQPHVFIPSDVAGNERVECGKDPLAPIDLQPWLEQDPFLMMGEQKIDSPISQDLPTPMQVQVTKEKKGISNRVHNITKVTHVDFIPNGSIGFHRVPNMTKIHDKLDMSQKLVTRPMNKLFVGINNKLDKGRLPSKKIPKPTANRQSTTTRRTVVIHNVEIELRSNAPKAPKGKKKKTDRDINRVIASAAQNTILKVAGVVRSQMNAATDTLQPREDDEIVTETIIDNFDSTDTTTKSTIQEPTSTQKSTLSSSTERPRTENSTTPTQASDNPSQSYKDFQAIIDSALQEPTDQYVRVHRSPVINNFKVRGVELSTHLDFSDKLRTLKLDKSAFIGRQLTEESLGETQVQSDLQHSNTTKTDNTTMDFSGTLRNIELRQLHERPIYQRPQKVVLDGPNADQYEIEINIRQTNPTTPKGNDKYGPYNNADKRYDIEDQHAYDYQQTQSTSGNNYYTQSTRAPYKTRTKPPTIIYIDEHDDRQTTTVRPPGFFQNIISFATNGFKGNKPHAEPTSSPFHHTPNRVVTGTGHDSGGDSPTSGNYLGSSQAQHYPHSKPQSSENYLSSQQVQPFPPPHQQYPHPPPNFPPPQVFPPQRLPGANSFSTVSSAGGVAHASSSAVSTGHFGAIVGQAISEGSDSTFSFNIRPSSRPQPNLVSPTGIRPNYELIPPRRTSQYASTPSYANPPKPISTVENFHYPPNRQDPFSSHTRRPAPPYYNERPTNVYDPAYDDLGRSELKIDETDDRTNGTKDDEDDFDSGEYDYNDDDEGDSHDNDVDDEQPAQKFDKDGYLRPEHMTAILYKESLANKTDLNATELDDNFVLPVLRQDDKFIETQLTDKVDNLPNTTTNATTFPDSEQKSLSNDILAEDYDEMLIARTSFLAARNAGRGEKRKRPAINLQVAFAPIKILTKPERPDNWVIFDTPEEKPLLPVQPDYNSETLIADEVPMPFDEHRVRPVTTSTTEQAVTTDITTTTDEITNEHTTTQLEDVTVTDRTTQEYDIVTNTELTHSADETTDVYEYTTDILSNATDALTDQTTDRPTEYPTNVQTDQTTELIANTVTDSPTDLQRLT